MCKKSVILFLLVFYSLSSFVCAEHNVQYSKDGKAQLDIDIEKALFDSIDKSIGPSSDPLFTYSNTNRYSEIYFNERADSGDAVKYIKDGIEIKFQPQALNFNNQYGQLEQISMPQSVYGYPDGTIFTYANLYGPGLSLRYNYSVANLKEELVIGAFSDLPTPAEYVINGGNVTLDLNFLMITTGSKIMIEGEEWDQKKDKITSNEVFIKDADDNEVFHLIKPIAYDSIGNKINLEYEFKASSKRIYVTLRTPYSWLNDSSTVYPVFIDPTVISFNETGVINIEVEPEEEECNYLLCNSEIHFHNNGTLPIEMSSADLNLTVHMNGLKNYWFERRYTENISLDEEICDENGENCYNQTVNKTISYMQVCDHNSSVSLPAGGDLELVFYSELLNENDTYKYNISFNMFNQTFLIDPYFYTGESNFDEGTFNNTYLTGYGYITMNSSNVSGYYTSYLLNASDQYVIWEGMEISKDNDTIVYVADKAEDAFKSTTSGTNFFLVGYDLFNALDLHGITGRSNGSLMFTIDQGSNLFQTIDYGKNWTIITSDYAGDIPTYIMYDENDGYLYVFDDNQDIWRSSNNGTNFTLVNSVYFSSDIEGGTILESGLLFVINGDGVHYSVNYGVSWDTINNLYHFANIDVDSNNNLYANIGTVIYKSTDFGSLWTVVNSDFNGAATGTLLNYAFRIDEEDRLIAITDSERAYVSVNGGQSFSLAENQVTGSANNLAGMHTYKIDGIRYQVRYSNNSINFTDWLGPDNTSTSYYYDLSSELEDVISKYMQYRIYFEPEDDTYYPKVYDIAVEYTLYVLQNETPVAWQIYPTTGFSYRSGDPVTAYIGLRDNENFNLNNKYCYIRTRYPNKTLWFNWTQMEFITESSGVYYYDFNISPSVEGQYLMEYRCAETNTTEYIKAYGVQSIYISPWANQINDTWYYLNDVVVPEINENEVKLDYVLYNQTLMYNKLLEIQFNVTNVYSELLNLEAITIENNSVIYNAILENEQHLLVINATAAAIYSYLTGPIQGQLDGIDGNITLMQSDLADIINYTDTLEFGQADIQGNLSVLYALITELENNVRGDISNVNGTIQEIWSEVYAIEWKLDCNNTVNVICDKLDNISSAVDAINASGSAAVLDYLQNNVSQDLSWIISTVSEINLTITGIDTYLTGTIYPAIDDLENNMTQALIDLNNVLNNQSNIYSYLGQIQENITNNYNQLEFIEDIIINVNSTQNTNAASIISEIDSNEARLVLINSTIESMYAYLQGDIYSLLQEINVTSSAIDSYLTGTIYPAIQGIETDLDNVLSNQTALYNFLGEIQGNISSNYAAINVLGTYIQSTNATLYAEINENEAHILILNNTANSIYSYITGPIQEQLDSIDGNISLMQLDLADIINYTDTLESGQADIQANLSALYGLITDLESNVRGDISNVNGTIQEIWTEVYAIEWKLDCNNTQNILCDKLDNITIAIDDINTSNADVLDYLQNNISQDLSWIMSTVSEINLTVTGIDDYLQDNITVDINQNEAKLDQLLLNATNIWDQLIILESNLSGNYQQLEFIENLIINVNSTQNANAASIISEIDANEAHILVLNSTITSIYNYLTQDIQDQLDGIDGNISLMQSDLTDIINYTDTLESGQADIQGNLSALYSLITDLESNVRGDISNVNGTLQEIWTEVYAIEWKLDCNNSVNVICDKLDNITIAIDTINTSNADVLDYLQNNISIELGTIINTVTAINLTVSGIDDYMQNTIYPAVDGLENNVSNILLDLDDVISNQSNIYSYLGEIQGNITTSYSQLEFLEDIIMNVNSTQNSNTASIIAEIDANEARLVLINSTIESMYAYLQGDIYSLLQEINVTSSAINSYLTGTIYPAIQGIEIDLDNVLSNQTALYNFLGEIQGNISSNYAAINVLGTYIQSTNATLYAEINENEAHILILNNTANSIYSYLTGPIQGQLDGIDGNISLMQSDLADIINYTDTLESGQADIQANLSALYGLITSLESNVRSDISNVNGTIQEILTEVYAIEWKLDCNNTVNVICDKLDNITIAIDAINTSNADVLDYLQNNISIELGTIINTVTTVNLTVSGIEDYLQNNVTVDINQNEAKLDQLLVNATNIWDQLIILESNLSGNYQQLEFIEGLIINVNSTQNANTASIISEIDENEAHILVLNSTIASIYSYLTGPIQGQLDGIDGNISLIQSDLVDIINYTDTLESGQADIQGNLSALYSLITSLESNVLGDISNVNGTLQEIWTEVYAIEWKLDCNNTVNVICDKLDNISLAIDGINTSNADVLDYLQNNVSQDLSWIVNTVTSINVTVSGIDSYLIGTIYPAIDNLENNVTEILFDLDDVLSNQSVIYSYLLELQGNITNNYNQLEFIEDIIINVNSTQNSNAASIISEIDSNEARLVLINSTIESMYAYLQGDIYSLLQEINVTSSAIDSYLTGTIYPAIQGLETDLDNVLSNQTALYNFLGEIQGNISSNYAAINVLGTYIQSTNATLYAEINENEAHILILNNTANSIYSYLTGPIQQQLDGIDGNISLMQSDLADIINYTDTLESGQADIQANLSALYSLITSLESNVRGDISNVNGTLQEIWTKVYAIEWKLDCNNSVNVICDKLDNLTVNIGQVNISNTEVLDYLQNNVTQDISQIFDIVSSINLTVIGIEDYLQNNITVDINQNEAKLDQLLLNATNIWDQLIILESNLSSNYQQLEFIQSLIINVNSTQNANAAIIISEVNENEVKIDEINTTVTSILTDLQTIVEPKLDSIIGNISEMQIDLSLINNSLFNVEQNQQYLFENLTYISGNIDNLQNNFSDILTDISTLQSSVNTFNLSMQTRLDLQDAYLVNISDEVIRIENKLDCNNSVNIVCDLLDEIINNTEIIQNDTAFIEDYLVNNVTDWLISIDGTVYQINITVRDILDLLQGVNLSNTDPINVTLNNDIQIYRYQYNLSLNFSATPAVSSNINKTSITVTQVSGQEYYENITLLNESSYNESHIIHPFNWPVGTYLIQAQAWDDQDNYGEDSAYITIANQVPGTPQIISPNGLETLSASTTVTWNNTFDTDEDFLSIDIQYSDDNQGTWVDLYDSTQPTKYTVHSCSLTEANYGNASGEITPNAEVFLNKFNVTLRNDGFYYIELYENTTLLQNTTSWCDANQSCTFFFNRERLNLTTYNWSVKHLDTGILAETYQCNNNGLSWISNGNQTMVSIAATPTSQSYAWDLSSLRSSVDYWIRMRTYDGYDYSEYEYVDNKFTVLRVVAAPSGSSSSGGANDYKYCNIETGECYSREEIEGADGEVSEEVLLSLFGAPQEVQAPGFITSIRNKTQDTVQNIVEFGESKGIRPWFMFILLIIVIVIIIYLVKENYYEGKNAEY